MNILFKLLIAYALCITALPIYASSQFVDLAERLDVSNSNAWKALLHYHDGGNGWVSRADDGNFFLSADGEINPREELVANLEGFLRAVGKDAEQHAQCRFPARFHWLSATLKGFTDKAPVVHCEGFSRWLNKVKPQSATLVFPTAYISNPSSMFGHTLLRVNGNGYAKKSSILSLSINYAAHIPKEDNAFISNMKGLWGGLEGKVSYVNYYDKVNEYNDIESRDIWEYELDLTQEEVVQLVRHTWELKSTKFDYYFFDENCSLYLLSLLDVARPGLSSVQAASPYVIPVDTVRVLKDKNVIKSTGYRPSSWTKLSFLLSLLPISERQKVLSFANGGISIDDIVLGRTPQEQARLVDVTYKYLRYKEAVSTVASNDGALKLLSLLSLRSRLPKTALLHPPIPVRPENGHGTARLTVYAGGREQQDFIGMKARPAFHDVLDDDRGYVSGAQIDFLSLDARHYYGAEQTELESLTLVDILALSPRNDFFKPLSWGIKLGWQQVHELPRHQLRFSVEGGGGITQELTETVRLSFLGLGDIRARAAFQGGLEAGIGIQGSVIWSLPIQSKLRLSTARWDYEGDHLSDGLRYKATFNLPVGNVNHSLRLEYQRDDLSQQDAETMQLGWNYYF